MELKRIILLFLIGLGLPGRLLSWLHQASAASTTGAPAAVASSSIRYVSPNGNCTGFGPCYDSLQSAVDAANPGDTIKLVLGHYSGVSARHGTNQVVYIEKSLTILGSYLPDWTMAYPETNPSILDAAGQGRVLSVSGPVSVTLDGIDITGGTADHGGGIYSAGDSLALQRCRIYGNQASALGGGLYLAAGSLATRDSQFFQNQAIQGGGLYLAKSGERFDLVNTLVYSNTAETGGGIAVVSSNGWLTNTVIAENHGTQPTGAGGLQANDAALSIVHSNLVHNTGGAAGMIAATSTQLTLTNTIVTNHTVGVQVEAGAEAHLEHTLWWANGVNTQGDGSITSLGTITGDPRFAPNDLRYHLQNGSAAIDQGVNAGVSFDIDHQNRPGNTSATDLGVDEVLPGLPIDVSTLPGGYINQEVPSPAQNPHGAMVWDGNQWRVTPTYAHKYPINVRNGWPLKPVTYQGTVDGNGPVSIVILPGAITVTQSVYTYTILSDLYGLQYQAVEYTIANSWSGVPVRLRSRGSGDGTETATFDVYIQMTPITTTAFRNDPVWFEYPMPIEQAVEQTDPNKWRVGNLPSDSPDSPNPGQYWMDVGGGADLGPKGIGATYILRTAASSAPHHLGSSSIVLFCYRWMDLTSNVKEFCVLPRILRATQINTIFLPFIVR